MVGASLTSLPRAKNLLLPRKREPIATTACD